MTTQYNMSFSECFPFSDTGMSVLLAAGVAQSWTVPGTAKQTYRAKFVFTSNVPVWVRLNGTAVVPTGVLAATYNQEMLDINFVRYVKGGDTLSFVSTSTPQVGVSLLLVQEVP